MRPERRYLPLDAASCRIEQRATEPPMVVGYASVFYDPSDAGTEYNYSDPTFVTRERVMPGCFDRSLREDDVRGLFNHNPDWILGRKSAGTLKLSVDQKGLRYEITPADTQCARDLLANIRAGNVTGSSFSFTVRTQKWIAGGKGQSDIRELHDVGLFDVGPVTFPAYTASTAGSRAAVFAAEDLDEIRAQHEQWRRMRATLAMAEVRARCALLGL